MPVAARTRKCGVSTFGPAPVVTYTARFLAAGELRSMARRQARCQFGNWPFKNGRKAGVHPVLASPRDMRSQTDQHVRACGDHLAVNMRVDVDIRRLPIQPV